MGISSGKCKAKSFPEDSGILKIHSRGGGHGLRKAPRDVVEELPQQVLPEVGQARQVSLDIATTVREA